MKWGWQCSEDEVGKGIMFEYWRARRKWQKLLRAQEREYSTLKDSFKTAEDYFKWASEWDFETQSEREDFLTHRTAYWRKKSTAKPIELPPDSKEDQYGTGYWEQSEYSQGKRFLTDKGVAYVRDAVRQETLASSELFFRVAAVVIGASLVVLSLVSVLK